MPRGEGGEFNWPKNETDKALPSDSAETDLDAELETAKEYKPVYDTLTKLSTDRLKILSLELNQVSQTLRSIGFIEDQQKALELLQSFQDEEDEEMALSIAQEIAKLADV